MRWIHRVELAFPILDPRLQSQIREVLDVQLSDTVKAREIQPDGSSARVAVPSDAPPVRSQARLYGLVAAESRTS